MENSLRVVILDQDPEARYQTQQMVLQLGYAVVAQTGLGTEAVSTVVDANPDVVLCAFREPIARVVHTVESITHATKECPVIAYAPNSSLELVRQAMLAGARDFLKAPLKPEELKRSLTSALEAGERWRLRESAGGNLLGPDGTIMTVFGAKGGVGKTTVAVNLAVALATEVGQKVLLVDADDTFGDDASSLSLRPEYSMTDILRQPDESLDSLDKFLTYHESGLAVAASPESPFEWRGMPVERFEAFLRRAARLFDVVLVDTSGTLSEINQAALEAASTVLWVTTPEYASVRDSLQALNVMRRLRVPEERIRFVLNVTSLDSEASPSSVREALGHDLFWVIPYDAQARHAAQLGRAIIGDAKSPAGATIANLALVLSGLPARAKNGRVKQQKRRDRLHFLPFRRRAARAGARCRTGDPGMTEQPTPKRADIPIEAVNDSVLTSEHRDLVAMVHQRLLQEIDMAVLQKQQPEAARASLEATARVLLGQQNGSLYGETKEAVIKAVLDDAVGLGPIQAMVDDKTISEVMVNSPDEIYFERDGVIYASSVRFRDTAHIMRIVDRIIAPLGRRVDESVPYVDARLPDGSRVNVVIPPLIPRSPTITIRKFRPDMFSMEDLVGNETIAEWMVDFFRACVQYRLNIVVSGGTGTGKTTFLNALSRYLPEGERIVTIEDPIELQLQQRHKISMEARPANIEGKNEVTQRDLVRNALRMRPDRILVGEVRGPEAFDMMQAMNTGHEGSMTTVHANSARDALSRIENMILMASLDLPIRAIREQMGSALHLVIHLQRFSDGKRRVVSVSEITGMEGDVVTMQDIFHFVQRGVDEEGKVLGDMEATGIRPTFAETLERAGVHFEWSELAMKAWR